MEWLALTFSFYIFMDYYFTCFRLLIHLGVNKILATGVLTKNRLHKCTIIGNKQQQKKENFHFEQCTSSKKAVYLWLEKQWGVYIDFSVSCKPKRLARCRNKVERKHIQEQQPSQFHCYNQNMDFVNRMTSTWSSTGLASEWKNGGGPRLFEM